MSQFLRSSGRLRTPKGTGQEVHIAGEHLGKLSREEAVQSLP